jgi:hypothetical protein
MCGPLRPISQLNANGSLKLISVICFSIASAISGSTASSASVAHCVVVTHSRLIAVISASRSTRSGIGVRPLEKHFSMAEEAQPVQRPIRVQRGWWAPTTQVVATELALHVLDRVREPTSLEVLTKLTRRDLPSRQRV